MGAREEAQGRRAWRSGLRAGTRQSERAMSWLAWALLGALAWSAGRGWIRQQLVSAVDSPHEVRLAPMAAEFGLTLVVLSLLALGVGGLTARAEGRWGLVRGPSEIRGERLQTIAPGPGGQILGAALACGLLWLALRGVPAAAARAVDAPPGLLSEFWGSWGLRALGAGALAALLRWRVELSSARARWADAVRAGVERRRA